MFYNLTYDETQHEQSVTCRRTASLPQLSAMVTSLRVLGGALRGGFSVLHQYEHLRSTGVQHDAAIKRAFGMWHLPAESHGAAIIPRRQGSGRQRLMHGTRPRRTRSAP
jgi:hypothetical protein